MTYGEWISVEFALPPFYKYVLARHNRGSWADGRDPVNVNCVVVMLEPHLVYGNDIMPYHWTEFGPDRFFGHTITHWMHIPNLKGDE